MAELRPVLAGHQIARPQIPVTRLSFAFAFGGFLPVLLLLAACGRKRNCSYTEHHQQGTADHLGVCRAALAMQFAENQDSPQQSPQLVGVG